MRFSRLAHGPARGGFRSGRTFSAALTLLALAGPALAEGETPAAAPAAAPVAQAAPAPAPAPKHVVTLGPEMKDEQGRVGRVHTVVRGDTLWAISGAYLGKPWSWPTIWKANQSTVENPNLIYPGEKLWIGPGEMRPLTDAEASRLTDAKGESSGLGGGPAPGARTITVATLGSKGMISVGDYGAATSLVSTSAEQHYLAQFNTAQIGLGRAQTAVGDQFTLFDEGEAIYDPHTRQLIGYLVNIRGWFEVTEVGPETSKGVIREAYSEIPIGTLAVRRKIAPGEIALRSTPSGVDGEIIALPDSRTRMGSPDYVFLNRGSSAGLTVGSELDIVRGGGIAADDARNVEVQTMPDVVATLVVVSTEPDSATAVVTSATTDIGVGDRFRGASR